MSSEENPKLDNLKAYIKTLCFPNIFVTEKKYLYSMSFLLIAKYSVRNEYQRKLIRRFLIGCCIKSLSSRLQWKGYYILAALFFVFSILFRK